MSPAMLGPQTFDVDLTVRKISQSFVVVNIGATGALTRKVYGISLEPDRTWSLAGTHGRIGDDREGFVVAGFPTRDAAIDAAERRFTYVTDSPVRITRR